MPSRARLDPNDYDARVQRLDALAQGDWTRLGPPDTAFILEGLGVAPDDFERVLRHAATITGSDQPAALTDACDGYRIGATQLEYVSRFSGRPIGVYARWAILVWPKRHSEYRRR